MRSTQLIKVDPGTHVLLVPAPTEDAAPLVTLLKDEGYRCTVVDGRADALMMVTTEFVDVMVVAVESHGLDTIRAVRDAAYTTYVLALAGNPSAVETDALYAAGADSELTGRLDPQRILGRIRSAMRRRNPAAPLQIVDPPSPREADVIAGSTAWQQATETLREVIAETFAVPVTLDDRSPGDRPVWGTRIDLTSAAHGVELAIMLGADTQSATALATLAFGAAGGAIHDVLDELGNVCMGTLKRALYAEGHELASGLPRMVTGDDVMLDPEDGPGLGFVLAIGEARLHVALALRGKVASFRTFNEIEDGMVLAQDVYSRTGVLMLPAGTLLSRRMIKQLLHAVPPTTLTEVIVP